MAADRITGCMKEIEEERVKNYDQSSDRYQSYAEFAKKLNFVSLLCGFHCLLVTNRWQL